jgi:hypothetical protein
MKVKLALRISHQNLPIAVQIKNRISKFKNATHPSVPRLYAVIRAYPPYEVLFANQRQPITSHNLPITLYQMVLSYFESLRANATYLELQPGGSQRTEMLIPTTARIFSEGSRKPTEACGTPRKAVEGSGAQFAYVNLIL